MLSVGAVVVVLVAHTLLHPVPAAVVGEVQVQILHSLSGPQSLPVYPLRWVRRALAGSLA